MINPTKDILLENLSSKDVRYILDVVCNGYVDVKNVRVRTDCIELIGYDGKDIIKEISFLYNSGRVVSIQRRIP